MLKRFGDNGAPESSKRPRLDTLAAPHTPPKTDNWGEDSDDEMLIKASQAFEDAKFKDDVNPRRNLSNVNTVSFNFETNFNSNRASSCKDSSTDGGYHSKIYNSTFNLPSISADDMSKNYKPDSDSSCKTYLFRTEDDLLQNFNKIVEENKFLKKEQSKLNDQNLTKDGEISILRAQLSKNLKDISAVKLEKLKHQEKMQLECNEKVKEISNEVDNYKSQLEFKTMEIVNLKEKCRLLESSKIKFVEPTMSSFEHNKWPGSSQRLNGSMRKEQNTKQILITKENSSQVYTNSFVILPPVSRSYYPIKEEIDDCIFKTSAEERPILFKSNKNLQFKGQSTFLSMREKILNTNSNNSIESEKSIESNIKINYIHEILTTLMKMPAHEFDLKCYFKLGIKIALISKEILLKCVDQLERLSGTITVKILREMDEKYFKMSEIGCDLMIDKNYFSENAWFEDEQAIEARRMLSVLNVICKNVDKVGNFVLGVKNTDIDNFPTVLEYRNELKLSIRYEKKNNNSHYSFLDIFLDILKMMFDIQCSYLYIGLLASICRVIKSSMERCTDVVRLHDKFCKIIKGVILLRPHITVLVNILQVLNMMENVEFLGCVESDSDNGILKLDYNERIATYDKNTCSLRLLCNNINVWLEHFVSIEHMPLSFSITDNVLRLITLIDKKNPQWRKNEFDVNNVCNCSLRLNHCLCSTLYRSAVLYKEHHKSIRDVGLLKQYGSILRTGIVVLSFCIISDPEFLSRLGDYENYCLSFVTICSSLTESLNLEDIHKETLADFIENLNVTSNVVDDPLNAEIWDESFNSFSICD